MQSLSVVIICKNEEQNIGKVLQSLTGLTDDVIVYDNGSTDNTESAVKEFPVRFIQGEWEGYAPTKRKAQLLAKYDWILSLDADESLDAELFQSLNKLDLSNIHVAYDSRSRNFIGKKFLKHGEWGRDHRIRLFNQKTVNWNNEPVHEDLAVPKGVAVKRIKGFVLHRTATNIDDYARKITKYALLSAESNFKKRKKATFFKLRISPAYSFILNYFFRLGFLDGFEGFVCAKMTAHYTFLKYARLRELWRNNQ